MLYGTATPDSAGEVAQIRRAVISASTCHTFPQNMSVFGLVFGAGFTGGLAYLVAKYALKQDEPQKWALYGAGAQAALYLTQKVTARCA